MGTAELYAGCATGVQADRLGSCLASRPGCVFRTSLCRVDMVASMPAGLPFRAPGLAVRWNAEWRAHATRPARFCDDEACDSVR